VFEYEDTKVRVYGDAAVVTGLARVKYRDEQQVLQEHAAHVIRVYARRQSRWLLVASQTTRTRSR
jgi:ketosteroid isomerase-like protein